MLRYRSDLQTVAYMITATALIVWQWSLPAFSLPLFLWANFMAVTITVIAHNHNHLRMWKSRTANSVTDYWLTLLYGFPAFAWIPTHNMNHHKFTNRDGDYTITYLFVGVALLIDWKKALLYIVVPQQFGLFVVLVFNYLQHVHADEESEINHSRNFVGPVLNILLLNNGYHTAHHQSPGTHWSRMREAHAAIADRIDPQLNERSFWWMLLRVFILGPFVPRLRSRSMRLARIERQGQAQAQAS